MSLSRKYAGKEGTYKGVVSGSYHTLYMNANTMLYFVPSTDPIYWVIERNISMIMDCVCSDVKKI
jgi:hypothetical protein